MNITERAKEYANGKALDAITSAIEKAYADGYNDGIRFIENQKLETAENGIMYVDLGLPSGTLWSSEYLINKAGIAKFPYMEASKLSIPTKEQFEELCKKCYISYHLTNDKCGIMFTGKNGKSILLRYSRIDEMTENRKDSYYFWIKDEEDSEEKICAFLLEGEKPEVAYIHNIFMGLKAPVMLVK